MKVRFCESCNKEVTNANWFNHCKTLTHRKNLGEVITPKEKKPKKDYNYKVTCEICNKTMNNKTYVEHLKTKRHAKNLLIN